MLVSGYRGDFTNTFAVGAAPTPRQRSLFDACVAALHAGESRLGPGTPARDVDAFTRAARRSAALGFDGKWVLNPAQAEVVNQVFSPTQDQFDRANQIVEVYTRATEKEGTGAVMLGEEMIDEASRKLAHATLERGRAAGMTLRSSGS